MQHPVGIGRPQPKHFAQCAFNRVGVKRAIPEVHVDPRVRVRRPHHQRRLDDVDRADVPALVPVPHVVVVEADRRAREDLALHELDRVLADAELLDDLAARAQLDLAVVHVLGRVLEELAEHDGALMLAQHRQALALVLARPRLQGAREDPVPHEIAPARRQDRRELVAVRLHRGAVRGRP